MFTKVLNDVILVHVRFLARLVIYLERFFVDSMNNDSNKNLIIFLRAIVVIFLIVILAIFGIIFIKLQTHRKAKAERATTEEEYATELEAVASEGEPEIADLTGLDIVSNAAPAPQGVLEGKVIHKPHMTDNTISLQKADLSVFQQPATEEATDGEQKKPEDADATGPWEKVSLTLPTVDGSINLSTPGEPTKTTQMTSTYMVLVDLDTDEIIAERDCDKVVSPASMTKILTVLTAREFISEKNLDDTFKITADIVDYVGKNDCSAVGFQVDDEVTVRDLLYGTILCSGADAAIGLARYCCGDEQTFVDVMNSKVEQMGLAETAHFTNVVGVYNEDLHCTMKDMSVILATAIQDDLLLDVLSKRKYYTDIKYEDLEMPDGIEISNWFLRRIEDKEFDGNVIAAKTGYVSEAGCCAASYYEADNGKRYICVTGNSFSSWRAIYDHVAVYRSLTP